MLMSSLLQMPDFEDGSIELRRGSVESDEDEMMRWKVSVVPTIGNRSGRSQGEFIDSD